MTMNSISKRLLSHFREIEVIKKGNKIKGIKKFDLAEEYKKLEDELFLLDETPINTTHLLKQFEEIHKIQEKFWTELSIILNPAKQPVVDQNGNNILISDEDKLHYITGHYELNTGVEITNWRICKGAILTDDFMNQFLDVMNIREKYAYAVVKKLKTIANVTTSLTAAQAVNPYPLIFKNNYAYEMFLELKDLTVCEGSVVADYSFIFHKMKHKDFQAINKTVTAPAFIKFLNEHSSTDISVVKLPFKNPKNKAKAYSIILNKYKFNILSNS